MRLRRPGVRIRSIHRILESKPDSAVEENLPSQPPTQPINLGSYLKFINQFNAAGTAKPRSVIAFSTASIDLLSEFRSRRKPLQQRHSSDVSRQPFKRVERQSQDPEASAIGSCILLGCPQRR